MAGAPLPIDSHVWSGVHTHSRRLARAAGPARGGSRRRAAGDRIAAGRQPRRWSRAAHAKDRRRRPSYTGVANGSYRRYVHARVVYIDPAPLSRSFWLSVCLCVQSVYYWLRGPSALLAANSCTRESEVRVSIPTLQPRSSSSFGSLVDDAHRSGDEHRHGRRRAFRGAIAVANVSCVEIRAPRSRAARRQLAAAIILRLFCSG